MLELRNVSTRYGQVQVLWEVSLTVGEGELVCLLGPNAAGKSTTMKTILGLVHPCAGEVFFRGQAICLPLTQLLTHNEPIVSSSAAVVNGTVYFGSADQLSPPHGRLYVFKLSRR